MDRKIQDEVTAIICFRNMETKRLGVEMTVEEAALKFIPKYASRYSQIWYDGIPTEELKEKLFG